MNSTALDAINASIAELARVVPTPVEPFGYGRDLSCVLDVAEDLAEVDPFSRVAIGQACLRRLITARGSLPDDRDYGLDVRAYQNRGTDANVLRDLGGRIRLELLKDDRVQDAGVTLTMLAVNSMRIAIAITAADAQLDPIDLTFAITDGEITVETLG